MSRGSGLLALAVVMGAAPLAARQRTPSAEKTGRYRLTLTGFMAAKATADDPRDYDGARDEVYAAAAFVRWDRVKNTVLQRGVMRTREYGDVGNAGQRGSRIQAGSATATGGIWTGKGNDVVPKEFDPRGSTLPPAAADQFPLLIWEGELTDGLDAVLVVPSLWESDLQSKSYENYQSNWKISPVGLLSTPLVQKQLTVPALAVVTVSATPGMSVGKALTTVFTGGLSGSFAISGMLTSANVDRPIGLSPAGDAAIYQERLAVVTREKLSALTPGAGITVAVPFTEPVDGALGGSYTLYLRVERIQ
jgi:hypothetical protein